MAKNFFQLVSDEEMVNFLKIYCDKTVNKFYFKDFQDMGKVVYLYVDDQYKYRCVLTDTEVYFVDRESNGARQNNLELDWQKFLISKFGQKYKNFLFEHFKKDIYNEYNKKLNDLHSEIDSLAR